MDAEYIEVDSNYQPPEPMSFKRSPTLGKLATALAAAQLEFEPIRKDTENPYYRSRYAELSSIIAATQKALAKQGLVIIQSPIVDVEHQRAGITSLMVHTSDEWTECTLMLPAIMLGRDGKPRFDAQSCGSAQTYARRYTYAPLIGVAAEPDDDANKSVGIGSKEAAQEVAKAKIAEHEAKTNGSLIPSLFYTWYDESQTARIEGDHGLMERNRDLLTRFWQPAVKAVVCDSEQLENLKYALEQRNVPFKLLKTVGVNIEKQLEKSIENVKAKKAKPVQGSLPVQESLGDA